jgi:uncharacterized membrane protein
MPMNATAVMGAVLTMLCWGSAAIFDKLGMKGVGNPVVALVVRLGVATVVTFVFAAATGAFRDLKAVPSSSLWALAAGAILASALGQAFYFLAIKHADASRIVPFTASYPAVALLLGILILHEPLTVPKVAGTALVLGGLMLLSGAFGK